MRLFYIETSPLQLIIHNISILTTRNLIPPYFLIIKSALLIDMFRRGWSKTTFLIDTSNRSYTSKAGFTHQHVKRIFVRLRFMKYKPFTCLLSVSRCLSLIFKTPYALLSVKVSLLLSEIRKNHHYAVFISLFIYFS